MSTRKQQSENFIHWCKDPERKKRGMEKRKITIEKNYTSEDISKIRKRSVTQGYEKIYRSLDSLVIYEQEKFLNLIKSLDVSQFYGKSGNRKLIKYDPILYKSLLSYTEFIKEFSNKVFFVLRLKVAENNLKLDNHMKCKCGLKTSFDPSTQDFTKLFCKKCMIAPNSREWFKYFYGEDGWEEKYNKHFSSPNIVESRRYSGRKSFESRKKKLFHGCLAKGKNEEKILNFIEKVNGIKIERCYSVGGYYLDGYCVDTNTAYEVYEQYHNNKSQIDYDIDRQKYIVNNLGCQFIIIKDDTRKEVDFDNLIVTTHDV
jgi:very-short-patch-repair endonuclease